VLVHALRITVRTQNMIMRLTSSAVHVSRHLDGHVEVHSLGLRETVGSGDIVCDLERDLTGSSQRVASGVHVTL
jgi:hypothetical protein